MFARFIGAIVVAVSMMSSLTGALAQGPTPAGQGWPSRYVTLVVPFAAGSATDALGRLLAARLSESLGQQVIVENVGGAGGMIGANRVAKAAPDGYQFLLGGVDTLAQNQTLYKTPLYNAATDFAPVALVGEQALVLVVRNELPAADLAQLREHAKTNAAKMQYASSGLGSASHLTCAQITKTLSAEIAHVPYRASGPALQDMIAGRIDYFCSLAAAAMPFIGNKQMRAIATLSKERSPFLPEVTTAREQGMPAMDSYFWSGAAFPKGTPTEIVDKLSAAISDALDTPAIATAMKTIAVAAPTRERRTPAYLKGFIDAEIAKWAETIKASGVSLD